MRAHQSRSILLFPPYLPVTPDGLHLLAFLPRADRHQVGFNKPPQVALGPFIPFTALVCIWPEGAVILGVLPRFPR